VLCLLDRTTLEYCPLTGLSMKHLLPTTVFAAAIAGFLPNLAHAATFTQIGDTGQTLSTAQEIPAGLDPLTAISGQISGTNTIGLFKIFLTGGQTFSATTVSANTLINVPIDVLLGAPNPNLIDPQLFLFDADGNGVYGNDDSFGSTQATLPSGGFSPLQSGFYFLAVASAGLTPVSSGGSIFGPADATGIFAPNGVGAGQPLLGFTGTGGSNWRYDIALTGVTTNAHAVPEPEHTAGLIAAAALFFSYRWGRKRRKQPIKLD
jgi:hypothetical protein